MYVIYEVHEDKELTGWVVTDNDGQVFWFDIRTLGSKNFELLYLIGLEGKAEKETLGEYKHKYHNESLSETVSVVSPSEAIDFIFMSKLIEG